MTRDKEAHREYHVKHLVRVTTLGEGPATVIQCPGLPIPGQFWVFPDDVDDWAWCRDDATVLRAPGYDKDGENYEYWTVEQTFSTKPPDTQRCMDTQREDPLLEPPDINGGFTRYQEEAAFDRFGDPIVSSSWELLRGPQVEFDKNRPFVKIAQNVGDLQYPLLLAMKDTVNAFPLWGFRPRCIKLSDVTFERKLWGSCLVYYRRTLNFDINLETFDRDLLDEGTKALKGHWGANGHWILDPVDDLGTMPDPANPSHYVRFKDFSGENCRCVLDGRGLPAETFIGSGTALSGCISCQPSSQVLHFQLSAVGSSFTGPYDVYNAIMGISINPSAKDPCTYVAAAGSVTAKVQLFVDNIDGVGEVLVTLLDSSGSAPPVKYAFPDIPLDSNSQFDCATNRDVVLLQGDPTYCPVALSLNPTGGPPPGPPWSGPPGVRHVEKYSESDFLLLGIPTSF